MTYIAHYSRDSLGSKISTEVPDRAMFEDLESIVTALGIGLPYFSQAAQVVVFAKTNMNNYPTTMRTLREQDDILIGLNSYDGLSEAEKAQLLIDTVTPILGI